jgi:16S rRNA (guanine527-N7)-methyltransferase
MKDFLGDCLTELNLKIDEVYYDKLLFFWSFLLESNLKINLISRSKDDKTRFIAHLVDSLTGFYFPWPDDARCIDFGSGGGFPALPLKICQPGWSMTLVESTTKKAEFLYDAAKALNLDSVVIQNDYLKPKSPWLEPVYDLVTTRGLASIKDSLPLAAAALKPGGQYLAYKGPRGQIEADEASSRLAKLKIRLLEVKTFKLPYLDLPRSLYLFSKE